MEVAWPSLSITPARGNRYHRCDRERWTREIIVTVKLIRKSKQKQLEIKWEENREKNKWGKIEKIIYKKKKKREQVTSLWLGKKDEGNHSDSEAKQGSRIEASYNEKWEERKKWEKIDYMKIIKRNKKILECWKFKKKVGVEWKETNANQKRRKTEKIEKETKKRN